MNQKCSRAKVHLRTRGWNSLLTSQRWNQTLQGYRRTHSLPSVAAIYWPAEGGSYVRYSSIIWLPTSRALIPNPARTLWCQVWGGPRRLGSFLYSIDRTADPIKTTEGKQHQAEGFKEQGAEEPLSVHHLGGKSSRGNSKRPTMDHNRFVRYKLRVRLELESSSEEQKQIFVLSSKGWRWPRVGPWGSAHFSQTREQGFHVRNGATARDQLTSGNPHTTFSPPAWEKLPLALSSIRARLGQTGFSKRS